jgi:two-component system chemotaxis response regulator CheB
MAAELVQKVRAAAQAKIRQPQSIPAVRSNYPSGFQFAPTNKIIAIGASTGGTEAIKAIVSKLPGETPGVLIVQHISPAFSGVFAKNLQNVTKMDVRVAQTGDRILPGVILVAPGDQHMSVRRDGAWYSVTLQRGPLVSNVTSSADVLFASLAAEAGSKAIGIILTGMGSDGAEGLKKMKQAGAFTIAQDESSSLVFGMPKKAIEMGAACAIIGLDQIADQIIFNLKS